MHNKYGFYYWLEKQRCEVFLLSKKMENSTAAAAAFPLRCIYTHTAIKRLDWISTRLEAPGKNSSSAHDGPEITRLAATQLYITHSFSPPTELSPPPFVVGVFLWNVFVDYLSIDLSLLMCIRSTQHICILINVNDEVANRIGQSRLFNGHWTRVFGSLFPLFGHPIWTKRRTGI